ncbi:kelch domain-containing protein 10-like [Babylonia areolata]|uniref:kelch domain-containing protein 10-like n=1 Tax=Babylonia areolata TaxID=304850 RepID=UPI003FCFEC67
MNMSSQAAWSRIELIQPASDSVCPHERSGHRVVIDEGNLYVLGGYNPDVVDSDVEDEEELCKRIFVQMWRFNLFFRRWTELQMTGDIPQYLASHSASLHGNTLLTFGGSGIPFGTRSSQYIHMCHLHPSSTSVCWKKLPSLGKVPQRKYGQCQLYQWPYLYIVGGTTGFIYNSDVHRFNLQTGEWTCLWDSLYNEEMYQKSPTGRYRHEMVLHQKQLLMFGGGQALAAFPLDKIPYFDLVECVWKEHQTTPDLFEGEGDGDHSKGAPAPRRCHSCVLHNNAVYVFGGRDLRPQGDLWRLSLETWHWTCLLPASSSPLHCYFHAAAVTASGSMYVFGGVTWPDEGGEEEEERRNHNVYRVRLTVPPLQELVWDSLSDSLRSLHSPALPTRLLHAGVPRHFIQRLAF